MVSRTVKGVLTFNKSILGWRLIAWRKKGEKERLWPDLPSAVKEYALVDKQGVVRDPEADKIINEAAKGKYWKVKLDAEVTMPSSTEVATPPHLDWDTAEYVGDGNDGVYFGAIKSGSTWWALATVDSNTGGFVDTLVAKKGYRSRKSALQAAKDAAYDWCYTNDVEI